MPHRLHPPTSDRYGHLYDAARERLRDHLDATYTTEAGAVELSGIEK